MSEARVTNLSNESNSGGPTISGITTFSGTNYFVPPVGNTEERPEKPSPGSLRFNTDSKHLEYYRGYDSQSGIWTEVESEEINSLEGSSTRILACGGYNSPAYLDTIDYFADGIQSNAEDFGNLTSSRGGGHMGCGSRTRGLVAGDPGGYYNLIDYITIQSLGNALDFGDRVEKVMQGTALSSEIRGVFAGGYQPGGARNHIDYVTIASTGNAVDFGDCIHPNYMAQGGASTTRGIIAGGDTPTTSNCIEYITITTTGNGKDFGDLGVQNVITQGGSNATRMIIPYCKDSGGSTDNTVEYITIATLGNAKDFGDLVTAKTSRGGAASRIHYYTLGAPGYDGIEQCTIATTGNFLDFANLSATRHSAAGVSNGHGGL